MFKTIKSNRILVLVYTNIAHLAGVYSNYSSLTDYIELVCTLPANIRSGQESFFSCWGNGLAISLAYPGREDGWKVIYSFK